MPSSFQYFKSAYLSSTFLFVDTYIQLSFILNMRVLLIALLAAISYAQTEWILSFEICQTYDSWSADGLVISSNEETFRKTGVSWGERFEFTFQTRPTRLLITNLGSDGMCFASISGDGMQTLQYFWINDDCSTTFTYPCHETSVSITVDTPNQVAGESYSENLDVCYSQLGVPCIFPFIFKGVRFDACTDFEFETIWCGLTYEVDVQDWSTYGQCNLTTNCPIINTTANNCDICVHDFSSQKGACECILTNKTWTDNYCNAFIPASCDSSCTGSVFRRCLNTTAKVTQNVDEDDNEWIVWVYFGIGFVSFICIAYLWYKFWYIRKMRDAVERQNELERSQSVFYRGDTSNKLDASVINLFIDKRSPENTYKQIEIPDNLAGPYASFPKESNEEDSGEEALTVRNGTLRKKLKLIHTDSELLRNISSTSADAALIKIIKYNDLNILNQIGEGSFGKVYLGEWAGARVAVKMISGLNDDIIQEICNEVNVMLDVGNHPNVVTFYGLCTDEGKQCMVLEYFDGGAVSLLITKIQDGHHHELSSSQKWKMMSHAAAGVRYLHMQGVVHRDIATRNLLYRSADYSVGVADFGMSRSTNSGIHQTQTNIGPIRWMSPEAIKDRKHSSKSDVWSFGCMIVEFITAEAPYEGKTDVDVILGLSTEKDFHPEIDASWDADLQNILKKCFRFHPDDRITMKEIYDFFVQKTKRMANGSNLSTYISE